MINITLNLVITLKPFSFIAILAREYSKIIDKCQSNIRRKFIDLKPNVFSSLRKENSLKRQQN